MRVTAIALALACVTANGCKSTGAESQGAGDAPGAAPGAHVDGQLLVLAPDSARLASLASATVGTTAPDSVRMNGRLVWNEDVTVRVFSPFAGRVVRVLADAGRVVRAGDTLALIASPDFGQAQADARRAATDLALAERTRTRTRDLFEHGVSPEKDVFAADADVARSRAEARRAEARLALYGGDSASVNQLFPLRAPLSGTVVERNITPGQEVRPDQMLANAPQLFAPLFVVTDPARLWVQLDLPERDVWVVKPGAAIAVRTQASPGRPHAGRILLVAGSVDPATRTVKARGTVDDPQGELKAEMLVTVDVPGGSRGALSVPAAAVLLEGDTHVVYVEEGRGRYRRAEITVGAGQDGVVLVKAGLRAGDKVVTSGTLLLEQLFRQSVRS